MQLYLQKICTDGNGLFIPIIKEIMSVSDVIVIETAASDIMIPMRFGTLNFTDVRRQAANITNVSSIPIPFQIELERKSLEPSQNQRKKLHLYIPIIKNGAARFKPINSIPRYIQHPNAANVAIMADKLPKNPSHGFERTTSPIIHVIILKSRTNN